MPIEEVRPAVASSVVAQTRGRAGCLRLSGPPVAGNARAALATALAAFGRDPNIYCTMLETADATDRPPTGDWPGAEPLRADLEAEYLAMWAIDRFPKPHVTLIESAATWPVLGLAICGTHKVADPAAAFAIREVPLGGVPGWGASHRLPALPGQLGLCLALTGASFDSALAYRLGWLTHRIPARHFGHIKSRLETADPVDPLLDELDMGEAGSALDSYLDVIERCFSADSVGAILARLDAIRGAEADWARTAAAAMRAAPPQVIAATHRLLTAHAQPALRDGLIMDFRVAMNWVPGRAGLDGLFAIPPGGDLAPPVQDPPSID